jgi:hypothetical protein
MRIQFVAASDGSLLGGGECVDSVEVEWVMCGILDTRSWLRVLLVCVGVLSGSCTQETQNKVGRAVANITGMDGVCDIYTGEKLVMRFIKVDKLTTPVGEEGQKRSYRYGYGFLDRNFNLRVDDGEKKLYFEVSDYSTSYIFYENPE